MPGNNMPGNNMPGNNMPGNNMPGNNMPGNNMPGNNMPCVLNIIIIVPSFRKTSPALQNSWLRPCYSDVIYTTSKDMTP